MSKRTLKEIENDYKRIRHIVDTTPVASIVELANASGLTASEVKTSLAKHPRIAKIIMAQLENNKEALKAQNKSKATANHTDSKSKAAPTTGQSEETAGFDVGVVIDASIAGIETLEDVFSQLFKSKAKIILTSITLNELEKMQKFSDTSGKGARHVLAMAAENQNKFLTVLIDESGDTPDDCIIKYCADNKEKITLLTSDKTMALKSRMYGVTAHYLKRQNATHPTTPLTQSTQPVPDSYAKITTLHSAKRVGDHLLLTNFNDEFKSVLLISNGIEYTEGIHVLTPGDEVYLAAKKDDYLTFAHYKITSLSAVNNCILIYSKRIYDKSDILNLPKAGYKSFMRNFKRRLSL